MIEVYFDGCRIGTARSYGEAVGMELGFERTYGLFSVKSQWLNSRYDNFSRGQYPREFIEAKAKEYSNGK